MNWAARADAVLARLFILGEPPAAVVREAYPFGERKYWPYKVWCRRVRAWRKAAREGRGWPCDTQHQTYTSHDERQLEAF